MKLIHLSDLHIGKRIEISMVEEQEYVLAQILDIIKAEKPHGVLIAGDVYDKSVPPAEAVTLLDDFLCKLSTLGTEVFIISGNHDSAERLAFGNRLMERAGIHLSPVYKGTVKPYVLEDEYGAVNIWALPFIKPINVRRFFPDKTIESYTDAVRAAIEEMAMDKNVRNVVIAHQFVTGAVTCDSEEVSVGGIDNVDVSVFDGIDYVALGHIHGPQDIVPNRVRYCGTPLKYSFSETAHKKSLTIVELGEKGNLKIRTAPLKPIHDMRKLKGSFDLLSSKEFYDRQEREDYLHIILTDEEEPPEAMGRLRLIYPNVLNLSYDNTRTRAMGQVGMAEGVGEKSRLQLFDELYNEQNGKPLSDTQKTFVSLLIEEIWEGEI